MESKRVSMVVVDLFLRKVHLDPWESFIQFEGCIFFKWLENHHLPGTPSVLFF